MSDFATLCLQPNLLNTVRRENYDGREWLVVPVIAQVAGVVNNELVTVDELSRFPGAWEGIPIVVGDHPFRQGMAVSARTQDQAQRSPGQFFNTEIDDNGKLKGEIWLDVKKAADLGGDAQRAVQVFENGGRSQVSTAYFRDAEKKTGVHKGKHYESVAHNLRPDHLCVLFDQPGACDWKAGCGAPRINADSLEMKQQAIDQAWLKHYNASPVVTPEKQRTYIMETYDDHIIARVGPEFYKIPFDQNDEEITFAARHLWEKVKEKRDWISVNIRTTARTPSYSGVETSSWGSVSKTFDAYRDGYYKNTGASRPEDLVTGVGQATKAMKVWIASKSLLGDSAAETFDDLLFFPVVNPGTNQLNRGALVAVTGGRGAQAKIPEVAKRSAQKKSRSLLKSKFKVKGNTLVVLSALQAVGLDKLWPIKADQEDGMKRDQMIQTLLACNHCQFTQDQLDGMEDDSLEHLTTMAQQIATLTANAEQASDQTADQGTTDDGHQENNQDPEQDPEPATNEQPAPAVPPNLQALADMVQRLGGIERLEDMITRNAATEAQERSAIMARLTANNLCAFNNDELAALPFGTLRSLDASLAPASYGGRFRPPVSANQGVQGPPEMPAVLFAKPQRRTD